VKLSAVKTKPVDKLSHGGQYYQETKV